MCRFEIKYNLRQSNVCVRLFKITNSAIQFGEIAVFVVPRFYCTNFTYVYCGSVFDVQLIEVYELCKSFIMTVILMPLCWIGTVGVVSIPSHRKAKTFSKIVSDICTHKRI